MPGYAPEEAFARSREAFAQIEGWLDGLEAAGLGHAALEEELAARGRELQRRLLQDHLDLRAAREQRCKVVTGPDGIARTRAEAGHGRLLATVFGEVMVSRIAYRAPGAGNVHPADAELGLPRGKHSHGLSKMIASGAARGSFEQARAEVACRTGCRLGKRQCQELARQAAADFAGFYASRPVPAAGPGDVLALSCDGKGIVVLPSQMRPGTARKARKRPGPKQDGRLSRGEVRNRRRIAETGAVFDITPVPRTADGILGPGPRPPGPKAAGKWVTASVADDAAAVVAAVFAEADRRDPARARTWIALADGNLHQIRRIRAEAAARNITVTIICDFFHVTEYLCAAASGLGKTRRKAAEKTAGYLDAKAPWLDYPAALANGWPISSGVIEGTCRHLVKDRMDITGARWAIPTAEAILQLRALHANGDFDAYWTYHLHREHERNHSHAYALAA